MNKLALYGGEPVRKKPFPPVFLGATLMGEEELEEIRDVIQERSPFRHYGVGKPAKVEKLEKVISEYFGGRYALAVSSGTAALYCAVVALGLGPGDEVILPAFGWYSLYYALVNLGVLPVFADVDERFNLDPADFERKITPRTRAVMIIHYQGRSAQMDRIVSLARARHLKIIEDCAQALGGYHNGLKLGTFGDITTLSFQANKMLTCGEGGAVVTANEKYFARAVRYHDLGLLRPIFAQQLPDPSLATPENSFSAMQFRMSELQGACMLAQFGKLERILAVCRASYRRICDHFSRNKHFTILHSDGDCGITLFLLFKTGEEAKRFRQCLEAEGVHAGGTSHCTNLVEKYPITSKKLTHGALPPFGKGFAGEGVEYRTEKCCPHTNDIVERNVAVGIGALYMEEDISDMIRAIEKVDESLYAAEVEG